MDKPILTKKTLENYLIIDNPGIQECTVAATIRPEYLINGLDPYYLVYLRVLRIHQYKYLINRLETEPYIPFDENGDYFVTGILFENQIKGDLHLPVKGELINVTFDYKYNKLKAISLDLIPRYQLKRIDITEIYPLLNLFKKYFHDKSNNKSAIPEDESMSISEL